MLSAAVPIGAAPQPPVLSRLFVSGQGGYHTYRIPALVLARKGTLFAFCEGRKAGESDHGEIDLLLRRSADNGLTWAPVCIVAKDGASTCGNPCPILDRKTGAVVLLFCKNSGTHSEDQIMRGEAPPRTVWTTTSRDEGLTWSTPREISEQVRRPGWHWYATGPCHGIQLADGRLLAPCDYATAPGDEGIHSHVIYSDDHGATWHIGGDLPPMTDECTVVERSDGSLYLNARNYFGNKRRVVAISTDCGLTWSPPREDPALIEPECQGSALRYSSRRRGGKKLVLFSNPASMRREKMTVRLSYDDGLTWPVSKVLWPGPAAYSDLVVTHDGMVGCLFEAGEKTFREALVYARFSLAWLTDDAATR